MDDHEALFNQPPRKYPELENLMNIARDLYDLVPPEYRGGAETFSHCLQAAAVFQKTTFDQMHRDTYDEQLAGCIRALVDAITNTDSGIPRL